jgi:hypothetical protein
MLPHDGSVSCITTASVYDYLIWRLSGFAVSGRDYANSCCNMYCRGKVALGRGLFDAAITKRHERRMVV